jgi:eukaryotic-like serine/threonine-protein kinase
VTPDRIAGDRYEVERRLGQGGMATVLLAHDRKLGRQVAIKLLADNLAGDEDIRERFMREARLAAKLDHPNVVKVFDVGEEGERPYIVMEHVDGGTLADRLENRRRRLSASEAVPLLRQLCEGLGHAHSRKLVHRDVKPQNLLLRDSDQCLKIADFGIARAAEDTRLTRTGNVIGTGRYMAPEQLADGRISPATDVYACGVVADEVLPRRRTPELREIVDRCLRKNPRERFADAAELCDALSSVGNGRSTEPTLPLRGRTPSGPSRTGVTARVPRTAERVATGTRRRFPDLRHGRALPAALLAVVAIVVGLVIAIGSDDSGPSTASDQAQAGGQGAAPTQPAPQLEDPAAQARALADWLRAQGR